MLKYGLVLILSLLVAACGGEKKDSAGGAATTPKAAAELLAKSMSTGDLAAARSLIPPADKLAEAFECPGDRMAEQTKRDYDKVSEELAEIKEDKVTLAVGEFDKEGSKTLNLKPGDEHEGCKVKAPVTVHISKVTLSITHDGKTKPDGETWSFYQFGGDKNWYFMK